MHTLTQSRYIGDGVYASFDGYQIILTTGSHLPQQANNIIALESQVLNSLVAYSTDLKDSLVRNETDRREI